MHATGTFHSPAGIDALIAVTLRAFAWHNMLARTRLPAAPVVIMSARAARHPVRHHHPRDSFHPVAIAAASSNPPRRAAMRNALLQNPPGMLSIAPR